jgi:hypothetical protein
VGLGFDGPQEKQVGRESCSGLEASWAGAAGIKGEMGGPHHGLGRNLKRNMN